MVAPIFSILCECPPAIGFIWWDWDTGEEHAKWKQANVVFALEWKKIAFLQNRILSIERSIYIKK